MVDFASLQLEEGSPIYVQLIGFVKRGLVAGAVIPGDEMPSRRVLSALLGVNPNTVQKAFRLLEEEGLLTSHPGAKSLITATSKQISALKVQLQGEELARVVDLLQRVGLDRETAVAEFARVWDERGESL